jgi:hypothetical protein
VTLGGHRDPVAEAERVGQALARFRDRQASSGPALLENTANNFSPASDLRRYDLCDNAVGRVENDHRTRRYLRRAGLWRVSTLARLRCCGRFANGSGGGLVALRYLPGDVPIAGLAGLQSCGSTWACPVDSAKIAARRRLEIEAAVTCWYVMGGRIAFSTLTMRHRQGDGLLALWDGLQGAWHYLTSGKSWQLAKARSGLAGFLRLVEVTQGVNGWHVHVHALLFLPGGTTAADLDTLHDWMVGRWTAGLNSRGLTCAPVGQLSKLLDMAAIEQIAVYFSKAIDGGEVVPGGESGAGGGAPKGDPPTPAAGGGDSARAIALEFTQNQTKTSRDATSTAPAWELLDRVFNDGDADALALWQEYEAASFRRRQVTWSKGLRDLLALGAEATDEDIAAEELGSSMDDLLYVTARGWASMVERPSLIPLLLNVTEGSGLAGARFFLDANGIDYLLTDGDPT